MEEGITLLVDMTAKIVIHKEMMTQKLINNEKVLVFLEGMKFMAKAKFSVARAIALVAQEHKDTTFVRENTMYAAYYEATKTITFSRQDLHNYPINRDRHMYITTMIGVT